MLLQSVVYPYVIASLLYGLGRMSFDQAVLLFRKGCYFYLLLWVGIFGCIYLLAHSIPGTPVATAIDASAPPESGTSLLNIILPANFFSDMTNNYVPAVVVFAILYGIAIEKYENKQGFLDNLVLVKNASVTIWNWIVRLAPIAVFAMFAHVAGTIHLQELTTLVVYLVVFLGGTLFLAFYTLPALISSLAPARYREIFSYLQGAYELAKSLNVRLVFVPFVFSDLVSELQQARFDIAMSGTYMTTSRLKVLGVSKPYYQSEMGLMVRSEEAAKFAELHPGFTAIKPKGMGGCHDLCLPDTT